MKYLLLVILLFSFQLNYGQGSKGADTLRILVVDSIGRNYIHYHHLYKAPPTLVSFRNLVFFVDTLPDTIKVLPGISIRCQYLRMGIAGLSNPKEDPYECKCQIYGQNANAGIWSLHINESKKTNSPKVEPIYKQKISQSDDHQIGIKNLPKIIDVKQEIPIRDIILTTYIYCGAANGKLYLINKQIGDTISISTKNLLIDYTILDSLVFSPSDDPRVVLIRKGTAGLKVPKTASHDEKHAMTLAQRDKIGIWILYDAKTNAKAFVVDTVPPSGCIPPYILPPDKPGYWGQKIQWIKLQRSIFKRWWHGLNEDDRIAYRFFAVIIIIVFSIFAGLKAVKRITKSKLVQKMDDREIAVLAILFPVIIALMTWYIGKVIAFN